MGVVRMPQEQFKLPRSSYDEVCRIISAYSRFNEPVGLDQLKSIAAMNETSISANHAFLIGSGVLRAGKKKEPTDIGRSLGMAIQHDQPDDIAHYWQQIVAESDFLSNLVSAIEIRKGMEPSVFSAHVAYSAGEPKTARTLTGARTVTELLKAARLVTEADGKLVAVPRPAAVGRPEDVEKPETLLGAPPVIVESFTGALPVSIQIQVQCSVDELDKLAEKLQLIIRAATGPPTANETPDSD
jgi:hypothetical protein